MLASACATRAAQLSPGQGARRGVGVVPSPHRGEEFVDVPPSLPRRPARTPAVPVDAHADDVATAHRRVRVDAAPLRDVADGRVARMDPVTVDLGGAPVEPMLAEEDLERPRSCRCRWGRARRGTPRCDREVEIVPEHPVAEARLGIVEADRGGRAPTVERPARLPCVGGGPSPRHRVGIPCHHQCPCPSSAVAIASMCPPIQSVYSAP